MVSMAQVAPEVYFVLASASQRRCELLAALAVPFSVLPTGADETVAPGTPPVDAVRQIAARKAGAAQAALDAAAGTDLVTLTADTIVALDDQLLGKPESASDARAMLHALSAREHDVFSAIVLAGRERRLANVVRTRVRLRPLLPEEIDASITAGTPFDKAGGYGIQDLELHPAESWHGCYCNVMGLPLWAVYHGLRDLLPRVQIAAPHHTYARCTSCPLRADGA